jgi:NAD(P)-dependent dehydrogenase (short-subunit alcohol dehydrogenase family)
MASGDGFRDRVAVITGGASGIGLAIAQALGLAGCKLVLADVEVEPLRSAEARLVALGAEVLAVPTDVAKREDMLHLAEATWIRFGAAHIVVHNAGVMVFGPTQAMSHADWLFNINVNLWGAIHGVEAFAGRMVDQAEGGHHLFTASFAGLVPNMNFGPYNVAKAGVVALAESLRKDLRGTGIGVSVLCPMIVSTNIETSTRNRPDELGGPVVLEITEEHKAHYGRVLMPEAVATLVLDGIKNNRMFIHTHKEAQAMFQARADRILSAFDHAL